MIFIIYVDKREALLLMEDNLKGFKLLDEEKEKIEKTMQAKVKELDLKVYILY